MIALLRRAFLAGTHEEVRRRLHKLVTDRPDGMLRQAVRPPVSIPGLGVQIALVRDVVAVIAATRSGEYEVFFRLAADGPFPRFTGMLTLAQNERVHLTLAGSYELSDDRTLVRDALLAHRIVRATAGAILSEIANAIEDRAGDSDRFVETDEEPA